ncbi:mannose-6-phosphate isomerase, class I [Yersinia vastinensis]|uniref:mannose-6-phosphate isomerase, class I n=1 Tax=Yersinia vastinensis TaxID=2890318 RepID=UPI0011A7075D|nr:mannose-6-phosphate isomerase, class I [Yersinia vastinensis]
MSHANFYPLTNVVKNYPWGSHTALNTFFHVLNPDNQPQAELWMGVHPAGSSSVIEKGTPLLLSDFIAQNKPAMLGATVSQRFDNLPFLLKILSAETALSIQVHPTKTQAEAGFLRQKQSGAADYNDENHKPELVYAITDFMAMNGFREIADIINNFKLLATPTLDSAVSSLQQCPNSEGLKRFFIALMQMSLTVKEQVLHLLVNASQRLYGEELSAFIQRFHKNYPNDIGILAPLILNCITLKPGEAMFLHPGTLHAYVQGTAIEVMASSDNVLRAGLTGKNINLTELVHCTSFEPTRFESLLMAPHWESEQASYPIPVDDFRFSIFNEVNNHPVSISSGEILLVISGNALLRHCDGEILTVQTGQSVFIPASAGSYSLTTSGRLCRVFC